MLSCRETCCETMNKKSSNFLKNRSYPNCATMLVWRLLKEDNSLLLFEEEGSDDVGNLCREFSLLRDQEASRARVWNLKHIKIGPVLDVKVMKVCLHQNRYGIEIMVESLFRDRTASWVRIMTNTWPKRQKPFLLRTLSTELQENLLRNQSRDRSLLWHWRHDPWITREDDGAVRCDDIMEDCKAKFDGASQWSINDWISFLAKGGPKKMFQYCVNPNSSKHFPYFKAIPRHSGGNLVDLAWQDNVLLPEDVSECIYRIGNVSEILSIIRSGLIPGGRSLKRDMQSVFFTIVNPMDDDQSMEEQQCDLNKARIVPYWNTWKLHQNTLLLVQLEARSEERIAISSNTITRNRSLQHTTCDLHWESSMHEDWRWTAPQSIPVSKVPSRCTETEFGQWAAGSTRSRIEKILRTPKRIRQLRWNPKQQHRLQNIRHTSIYRPTTGHESQRNGQKVDPAFREPPEQGVFLERLE